MAKHMIHKSPSFFLLHNLASLGHSKQTPGLLGQIHWSSRRKVDVSWVALAIVTEGFHPAFKDLNPSTFSQNSFLKWRSKSSTRFYIVGGKSSCDIVLVESQHCGKTRDETKWVHSLGQIQWLVTKAHPHKSREPSHVWGPWRPLAWFLLTRNREPISHGNSYLKLKRYKVNT